MHVRLGFEQTSALAITFFLVAFEIAEESLLVMQLNDYGAAIRRELGSQMMRLTLDFNDTEYFPF